MSPQLTLTLPPAFASGKIQVEKKRFSIGRTPENDLVIEDSSLSRRHALIENFEGRFNLSDCGSSNGTFVNGQRVTGLTELSDWDVLTFGGVGDILVRIEYESEIESQTAAAGDLQPAGERRDRSVGHSFAISDPAKASPLNLQTQSWLSGPVIAVVAAAIIIMVTGLALLIGRNSDSSASSKPIITRKQPPTVDNDNDDRTSTPNDISSSPTMGEPTPLNSDNPESNELSTIETYASRVLSSISKDTHQVLTQKPLAEISSQVQRYKGSSAFRDQLQSMKRALPQVTATAKSNGVRPALAVYASLAEIDKAGGRGDPVQVAGSVCQSLSRTRAMFGDEQIANDTLLWVASLEEGPALQAKITKFSGRVNDSPATIRTIWYLHDHQVIGDQTYTLVVRFLAFGVIAQNPQKFGIAADPLTF
jgi:predicted component of type VI protein secretion system